MTRMQSAIALAAVGMDACWLFAAVGLASMITGHGGPALSFVGVLVLLGTGYGAAWVLERIDISLAVLQAISAVLGAMVVTAVAQLHTVGPAGLAPWAPLWFVPGFSDKLSPPQTATAMVTVGAGLLLWWRGVRLTQRDPGFEPVLWSFRIGFGVVSLEALLEALLAPAELVAWVTLPFFSLGLIALSLAHFEEVGQDTWAASVRRWVWLPPLVIGAIAVVAVSVGIGVSAWAWDLLRLFFSLIDRAVTLVFFGILLILGLIAELMVNGMRMLLRLMGVRVSQPVMQQFDQLLKDLRQEPQDESFWLRFVAYLLVGALVALAGGSILLWLANALGRRRDRVRQNEDEERESLWSDGVLGEELQDLMMRLVGRLRPGPGGPSLAALGRDPRGILLRVYYQLLQLAARRGVERPAWQTPAEFQSSLVAAFPGGDVQITRITQGFIGARYDPLPPEQEVAARVEQDWEELNRPVRSPEPEGQTPSVP